MSDEERRPFICPRCGIDVAYTIVSKRQSRGKDSKLCKDCSDVKPFRDEVVSMHPVLGMIRCRPYKGDLDENWNPIDAKGNLYLPGERICGHKDCVARKHILKVETLSSGKILERVQAE